MPKKPINPDKPRGWTFNKQRVWDEEFVHSELKSMINELLQEEENKTIKIMFMKELCIKRGYSNNLFNTSTQKFIGQDWFTEGINYLKDMLWLRLMKLGLSDARKAGMVIWLDKTVYKTKEPMNEEETQEITIKVNEI